MANSPQGKGRVGPAASSFSDSDPTRVEGLTRAQEVELPSVGGTLDTNLTAAGRPAAMGRGPKAPVGESSTRVSVIEDMPLSTGDEAVDRLGSTLGSYQLKRIIGRGGMGCVYEALHTKLGRSVALKLLHSDYARRRDAVARFFQEARAVNQIRHRNIVDITDLVELDDGTTFIIMELLEGGSLSQYMRQGRQEKSRTLGLLVQICDALAAAHSEGIIHRDLKPDNIIIATGDDGQEVVKLLDFGVAKLMHVDHEEGLTAAGAVVGTPAFMSPEQAAGLVIDHRADIYSLGAIMYEVFCEQPLFRGKSFGEYVRMHLEEQPRPTAETRGADQVDPALSAIILKCLAKSPERRYQTATQLRSDLFGLMTVEDAKRFTIDTSEDSVETLQDVTTLMVAGGPAIDDDEEDETLIATGTHTPAPLHSSPLAAPQVYGMETAMTLGDVPTQRQHNRNRAVMFGGLAVLAAVIIVAAVAAVGASGEESPAAANEEVGPTVDSIESEATNEGPTKPEPAVAKTRKVEIISKPKGRVFRMPADSHVCDTPCSVEGPSSGNEAALYVVRQEGYEDAELRITKSSAETLRPKLTSSFAPVEGDAGIPSATLVKIETEGEQGSGEASDENKGEQEVQEDKAPSKETKTNKTDRTGKSTKTGRTGKSTKTGRTGKSTKTGRTGKSTKTGRTGKGTKTGKAGKDDLFDPFNK